MMTKDGKNIGAKFREIVRSKNLDLFVSSCAIFLSCFVLTFAAVNNGMASNSGNIITSTNSPTGYSLVLQGVSDTALQPSTGTVKDPIALAQNSWGYALASTSAVGVLNDFDAGYATPSPSIGSKWANPTTAATIKKTTNSATNDTTAVYYGARVDLALPSGAYSNSVTYTATVNISDIPTPSIISVTPSSGNMAGGTAMAVRCVAV